MRRITRIFSENMYELRYALRATRPIRRPVLLVFLVPVVLVSVALEWVLMEDDQ